MPSLTFRKVILGIAAAAGSYIVGGAILDSVSNAIAQINWSVTVTGTFVLVLLWIILRLFLKRQPLQWKNYRVTRLGYYPACTFVGIILLLWTPPVVTLVSLFMPMIRQHGAANSNNVNRSDNDSTNARIEDINSNVIIILVANFQGPDPQNYLVADKIIQRLQAATSGYSDITIQPLAETITEQTGSKGGSAYARDLGTKRNASIVLWGFYGVTSEKVDVSVHYEVLRQPKRLSLRQNLATQTLPISDLNNFKIQTRLSGEMTYLVLLTVGLARYESGDYDAAIDLFTKALAQPNAPDQMVDSADIYFYRGNAYSYKAGANRLDRAIADYTKAIRLKPDDPAFYVNRGNVYDGKGQHDRAIADYNVAIRLQPDLAVTYYNRGIAYAEQGKYARAITDFTEAIRLKPDLAEAYYNRGFDYYEKGQYDRAIADCTEAIRLKPDDPIAYSNRGVAYAEQGEYDRAITDFTEAIRLKPDDPDAYYNRGLTYVKQGHPPDRVIADCTEAIKLKPDHANAYLIRAGAYQYGGEIERAIADCKSVLRISNDPEMRQRAEQGLRELGVK